MVTVNEIATHKEGNVFWADATEVVDVPPVSAWKSLAPLLMQITASDPPRYLPLAIRTFNMPFADVELRIQPVESGCKLSAAGSGRYVSLVRDFR